MTKYKIILKSKKTVAIIVAGGKGKRMGRPKQFISIAGKPVLWWTVKAFQNSKSIDGIVLVVNAQDIPRARRFGFSKVICVVAGGLERQDSVYNGILALPDDVEVVAIHDGARPLISSEIIEKAIDEANIYGAVVVGVPVKDTIKQIQKLNIKVKNKSEYLSPKIQRTLDRETLWSAQTPQVFRKEVLLKAYKKGYNKYSVTDDAMLVERLGIPVKMVMGSYTNLKITTPEDLLVASQILKKRRKA
ncbi:MAG: 2-C-methyl-D-erythritol 4-phosphate cytidylyltransferase [Candidatus Margulisiibacteriota bacterium]